MFLTHQQSRRNDAIIAFLKLNIYRKIMEMENLQKKKLLLLNFIGRVSEESNIDYNDILSMHS